MPAFDGMGPRGFGPRTGRGAGPCPPGMEFRTLGMPPGRGLGGGGLGAYGQGFMGGGLGRGLGRGFGGGFGRGFGRRGPGY